MPTRPMFRLTTLIPQLSNLAFFKTHKTGSTTLASIFYRYGVRHNLKVRRAVAIVSLKRVLP